MADGGVYGLGSSGLRCQCLYAPFDDNWFFSGNEITLLLQPRTKKGI